MKRIFTLSAILVGAVVAASCTKDLISPEELFRDETKVAKSRIYTKVEGCEDTVTTIHNKEIYRRSEKEGQSWFVGHSSGEKVHDSFMMFVYFDNIDRVRVGNKLSIRDFDFGFYYSSDSNAYTNKYSGSITVADKGDDYVILRFNNFSCSCSLGDCVTDGYLYCPLYDEFVPIYEN